MAFYEQLPSVDKLKILNQERLHELENVDIVCLAVDLHGFIISKNEKVDLDILTEEIRILENGGVLIASTGFGERSRIFQNIPLENGLRAKGLDPQDIPFFLSTRNGALTVHGFTGRVIDDHPMTADLYEAITSHELVRALNGLTCPDQQHDLQRQYAEITSVLRFPLHPNSDRYPGIRHDWSPITNHGYQLTAMYKPSHIETLNYPNEHISTIYRYSGMDRLPTRQEMTVLLKQRLHEEGIHINTATSQSHEEIDIVLPGIDKSTGCRAMISEIADWKGMSESEVWEHAIGGGDSPDGNDRPLVEVFKYGVTNMTDYIREEGPVVLDYRGVTDPLQRTLEFLKKIHISAF